VILLARHGETADNRDRRFQGQGPVALNELGREQARALAADVAGRGIGALYASPVPRAAETAGFVAEATGLDPVFDARLAETDTGEWTGRLMADVEREDPDGMAAYARAGTGWGFPGGETLVAQTQRVLAALDDIAAAHAGAERPTLVVCHRGVIRVALCSRDPRGLDAFSAIAVPNGSLVEW
jgi:glucosyl-3-phosphoglycerate phosphatase